MTALLAALAGARRGGSRSGRRGRGSSSAGRRQDGSTTCRGGLGGLGHAGGDGGSAGGDGKLRLGEVGAGRDLRGARDVVRGDGSINVYEQAGVALGVEGLAEGSRGREGAGGAGDGKIKALGVILGAVGLLGAVQRNDFVTPHVVARGELRRDLHHPRVVVGNQLVARPGARQGGVRDEADGGNLEELERRLVDGRAVAVAALGEHVDHGPVVRARPVGPVHFDVVACLHRGVAAGGGGVLVADDVPRGVGVRRDVAVVGVVGGPSDPDGRVRLVSEEGRCQIFLYMFVF